VFCITAALMVGTAGLPHVIVRFFTVPKVRDARVSAGWALVFIAILYTTAPAVGVRPRQHDRDDQRPPTARARSTPRRRTGSANWEKTGLIKWEDKNGDGRMFYAKTTATR
jgi:cation/acetate symporter